MIGLYGTVTLEGQRRTMKRDRTVMDILGGQQPWREEDVSNIEDIQEEGDPIVQWIQLAIDIEEKQFFAYYMSFPSHLT